MKLLSEHDLAPEKAADGKVDKKEVNSRMKNWKFIGNKHINFISPEQIERYSEELAAEVICILPETEGNLLDQLQIILNEEYAAFGFWVTEEAYCRAGGCNNRLKNGTEYELLIRLSGNGRVGCIADARVWEAWAVSSDFYTDAYVLSRYAEILRENQYFELFLADCVQYAMQSEEAMAYLEEMLRKGAKYWDLYQATQPFLILLAKTSCYNVVNDMARKLAQALLDCGKSVELCDLADTKTNQLLPFIKKHYQAVIGFQNKLFECYLEDSGCYLTDLIYAPKLQVLFDHPSWFCSQLTNHGKDFFLLSHDESYVKFVRDYAPSVSGSFLLPLGGIVQKPQNRERSLDVIFLGTYWDYRVIFGQLRGCSRNIRHMAARYLKYLKKWANQPAEYAFQKMLFDYGIEADKEDFVRMMYEMGFVHTCIIGYFREKIIGTLLAAGICLHVYGESWKSSPFIDSDQLICHDEVAAESSGNILQNAKVSLNILSWHKGGCNERLINSMLAGAVAVTDKSSYIEKHFVDGEELYVYDLQELKKLPETVKMLLERDDVRQRIAENGRKKAEAEYSMTAQAKRVIAIVEQIQQVKE